MENIQTKKYYIKNWLLFCCIMVAIMVVIGGVTRLTGSGLSITEWKPIMGIIPPLSMQAWQDLFILYQQSPEFVQINYDMTLEQFKSIFWLEYIHRVIGRLTGIIFATPLIYFTFKKYISAKYSLKLFVIFLLGGLQAFVGWVMVKSGLINVPNVSPYKLSLHLGLAFLIFSLIWWEYLRLSISNTNIKFYPSKILFLFNIIWFILLICQIIMGAFVAGHDAGLIYNEIPFMGNSLIPHEFYQTKNIFDDPASVQFIHRMLAVTLFILFQVNFLMLVKELIQAGYKPITHPIFKLYILLYLLLLIQIILGIITLLYQVPVILGVLHQFMALVLFATTIKVVSCLKNSSRSL